MRDPRGPRRGSCFTEKITATRRTLTDVSEVTLVTGPAARRSARGEAEGRQGAGGRRPGPAPRVRAWPPAALVAAAPPCAPFSPRGPSKSRGGATSRPEAAFLPPLEAAWTPGARRSPRPQWRGERPALLGPAVLSFFELRLRNFLTSGLWLSTDLLGKGVTAAPRGRKRAARGEGRSGSLASAAEAPCEWFENDSALTLFKF